MSLKVGKGVGVMPRNVSHRIEMGASCKRLVAPEARHMALGRREPSEQKPRGKHWGEVVQLSVCGWRTSQLNAFEVGDP